MPKFLISVPVTVRVETEIEASSLEEAEEIAQTMEPWEFDNFADLQSQVADMWREVIEYVEVEECGKCSEGDDAWTR